jgi:hypothetical protein
MNIVHIAFLSVMRRFLASNSQVILSLIAIKDRIWRGNAPAEESRGTGARVHHFVILSWGPWLTPAGLGHYLKFSKHFN